MESFMDVSRFTPMIVEDGWIFVTGFKVLLISQHLFPEILLEMVLRVHARSVKIKGICI
jgi:hypothetical protein